jgi:hypothetical protein
MVMSRRSSIEAGNVPLNEPSLPTMNETTMPLPVLTIMTVEPGVSEPAGALTVTLPLASGKVKVTFSTSTCGGASGMVVNDDGSMVT